MATFKAAALFLATALAASTAEARYYGRVRGGSFYRRTAVIYPRSRYYGPNVVVVGRHLLEEYEGESADAGCKTVVDILSEKGNFGKLIEATSLLPQEFVDDLKNKDKGFTFFAPTDKAIDELVSFLGETPETAQLLGNDTVALAILSYHIVPDETYKAEDLSNDMTLVSALGSDFPLMVDTDGGGVVIQGIGSEATVVEADLEACKGIVHVIDHVLLPADADGEFGDDPDQELRPADLVAEQLEGGGA